MTDTLVLLPYLALFGGIGVLGLALLALGAYAAKRRPAVILIALASGTLMLAQTAVFYFLSDMSSAWGGDTFGLVPLLCGVIAAAAIAWFLIVKL